MYIFWKIDRSHRQDVYEQLKFNLYQDDAVTGEAAGIAMGMVMLGSISTMRGKEVQSPTRILQLLSIFIYRYFFMMKKYPKSEV